MKFKYNGKKYMPLYQFLAHMPEGVAIWRCSFRKLER